MSEKCEHCHQQTSDVKLRTAVELPENVEGGYYCQNCVDSMNDKWWKNEQLAYIYDNSGNRADESGFDPEDEA